MDRFTWFMTLITAALDASLSSKGMVTVCSTLVFHLLESDGSGADLTRKRVLGTEHPDTLTSMINLASLYSEQGRWKEAEKLGVLAMETTKRVLGTEHPDTLASMANLASTFSIQGRWKEAEDLEVQAVETSSRVLGKQHPDTLTYMANLAFTLKARSRDDEATLLMEDCLLSSGNRY